MEFNHTSVLLNETVDALNVKKNGIYVDGTLGGAGHASLVCERLSGTGRFIGIDQDADAIAAASKRLEGFSNVTIVRDNYSNLRSILERLEISGIDGMMADLGVSSYQLDTAERGFSYMHDAPLDMRMDQRQTRTAADLVNGCDENELTGIIRDYGEDSFAKQIARSIVRTRQQKPIETTFELVEAIKAGLPAKVKAKPSHPAKKTFQAIRIALNGELDVLETTISDMIDVLLPGGRLAIITFHSLEDRIVKQAFQKAENPCTCPREFPVCVCGKKPLGRQITRKPIIPGEEEMEGNPRSKSAKLRVFEKKSEETE